MQLQCRFRRRLQRTLDVLWQGDDEKVASSGDTDVPVIKAGRIVKRKAPSAGGHDPFV